MFNKKSFIAYIAILICLTTALTMALSAADKPVKGKAMIGVTESFFIASNEYKPGQYQVKWESTGSDAVVTFVVDEKTDVKIQGKVVTLEKQSAYDTLLTDKDPSGHTAIKGLLIGGKPFKIVF